MNRQHSWHSIFRKRAELFCKHTVHVLNVIARGRVVSVKNKMYFKICVLFKFPYPVLFPCPFVCILSITQFSFSSLVLCRRRIAARLIRHARARAHGGIFLVTDERTKTTIKIAIPLGVRQKLRRCIEIYERVHVYEYYSRVRTTFFAARHSHGWPVFKRPFNRGGRRRKTRS